MLVISLSGCSTRSVSLDAIRPLESNSSFRPLFYIGSDNRFHYFDYLNVKTWRHYKIERSQLMIINEFSIGDMNPQKVFPGWIESGGRPISPLSPNSLHAQ